jgi:hypothetical protein
VSVYKDEVRRHLDALARGQKRRVTIELSEGLYIVLQGVADQRCISLEQYITEILEKR